jgi:hypothetical protein
MAVFCSRRQHSKLLMHILNEGYVRRTVYEDQDREDPRRDPHCVGEYFTTFGYSNEGGPTLNETTFNISTAGAH